MNAWPVARRVNTALSANGPRSGVYLLLLAGR